MTPSRLPPTPLWHPQNGDSHHPEDAESIRLERISHRFGHVQALDKISLNVPRGSIYGLLGPNGAGKTTTLRILLGLLKPERGIVRTLGFNPRRDASRMRHRVGVLLEHDGHYEPMSVTQNLEFYGRLYGLPPKKRQRRIDEVLELFQLRECARKPAGTLSKGMKRKLAIARAVLHEPELVILDEPTTGLDARAVAELREGLTRIVREHNVTLLVATHNLSEAERMCDRVGVLDQGRIILEGPPHLVGLHREKNRVTLHGRFPKKSLTAIKRVPGVATLETHDASRIVVHLDPTAHAAPVVQAAIENGARVESVGRPRASLEEAFLTATATGALSPTPKEVP